MGKLKRKALYSMHDEARHKMARMNIDEQEDLRPGNIED
jgi:hypothetical protein